MHKTMILALRVHIQIQLKLTPHRTLCIHIYGIASVLHAAATRRSFHRSCFQF